MFKTKKQLRSELDFAYGRCYGHEKSDVLFKEIFKINQNTIDRLNGRICKLMEDNGKLKRDLEIESRQKEELADLLADTQNKLHNAEQKVKQWESKHSII